MKIDPDILIALGAIVGFFASLIVPDGNIIIWFLGAVVGAAVGLALGRILKRGK